MDHLILAIALLGVGVLGMGWLSWSARSSKTTNGGKAATNIPDTVPHSKSPKIIAYCRTPSTMMVNEDKDHFYVTYKVGKRENGYQKER